MFQNVGKKIQQLAKAFFIIGIIIAVIVAVTVIVLHADADRIVLMHGIFAGILSFIILFFLSWLVSLFIFAHGKSVECAEITAKNSENSYKLLTKIKALEELILRSQK